MNLRRTSSTFLICIIFVLIDNAESFGFIRLCITSDDNTQFPTQCVLCSRFKLQSIYQACTGTTAPQNIPYTQAYCIVNNCLRQVPLVGKRKREAGATKLSGVRAVS
ncbi:uncharacterized protein LOC111619801 isoform X1 [Centruroides sculpturatus]|uniref:uncharacterized protein LOC111619801 isoform X1 n=1 Tax=Centruroides sculpturatus TaxID=218467 RepID=UPI000C6E7139|nr:uncharacterized protein LOC111619801 isoform X1 [Centruroides sculpturatus]XP_023217386.1 uncharacterized protein LOC111619801 isoform X1 [Centruroides sculpturatus]